MWLLTVAIDYLANFKRLQAFLEMRGMSMLSKTAIIIGDIIILAFAIDQLNFPGADCHCK